MSERIEYPKFVQAGQDDLGTTSALYEYYNEGDNTQGVVWGNVWKAQTFTIGTVGPNVNHTISSLKLKMYKLGNPGIITISIQGVDGTGKPDGVDVSTGTTNGNTLITDSAGEWRTIIMTAFVLQAGIKYAIVVRALTGDTSNFILWKADSSGAYTGGSGYYSSDSGVNWTIDGTSDYMFEVWGISNYKRINFNQNFDAIPVVVASPSTLTDCMIDNKTTAGFDVAVAVACTVHWIAVYQSI